MTEPAQDPSNQPAAPKPTESVGVSGSRKYPETLAVLGAALAMLSAAVSTWQAGIARDQTAIARDSLNDERRARAPKLDGKDLILSQFRMDGKQITLLSGVWFNSGQSGTEEFKRTSGCGRTPDEAMRTQVVAPASSPIAPGAVQLSGGCPLVDSALSSHLENEEPIFLAANASYTDRFGVKYESNLCYGGIIRKQAGFRYNKNSKVNLQTFACDSFNCTRTKCTIKEPHRLMIEAQSR